MPPNTLPATLLTSTTSATPLSSPTLQVDSESYVCSPLAEHSLDKLPEIISQPYDPPPPGKDERHHGVDFAYYRHAGRASIEGEGVQSIMAGRVAAAIHDRLPYGNMVIIETPYEKLPGHAYDAVDMPIGFSLYHLYAHLIEKPLVEVGAEVTCGELLGHVGKTGYVVPVAHLHLETRIGPPDVSFESMVFFDSQATPDEQAAYILWRTSGDFQHFDPLTILSSLNKALP